MFKVGLYLFIYSFQVLFQFFYFMCNMTKSKLTGGRKYNKTMQHK